MPMTLTSITIQKKPKYNVNADSPALYEAKCAVSGEYPFNAGITVDIPADKLAPIVDLMQQLVAQSMADAAAAFAQDVTASLTGPALDHQLIEAPTPPPAPGFVDDQDDPVPF